MKENDKVTTWNDECPVHKNRLRAQYEFGNKMNPSMIVSTFEICRCACSHRENDTRYHTSYANARNAAVLQKEMDAENG